VTALRQNGQAVLAAAFTVVFGAACGGESAQVAALTERIAALEALQERLHATLREHGIVFRTAAPRDAAEAVTQAIDDLDMALGRLQAAKEAQDQSKGQQALAAGETAMTVLRSHVAEALPKLLARAEAAPEPMQQAWFECFGRVGGPAGVPALQAIANAAERPASLRAAAVRALVGLDPLAAIPAVAALLLEPKPVSDLYLLLHMLASTGRTEAVPLLIAALQKNSDRSVRCHAATGLGNFPGEAATEALAAAAIGDEYPAVRTNALRALVKAAPGERVRDVATRVAAADPDAGVRTVANGLVPASGR
jgi:hypothetical protein